MNILRFGRGDFLGILIPGVFLLLNIVLLFPIENKPLYIKYNINSLGDNSAIIIPLFFILSYILGFSLRLINPSILEMFALITLIPLSIIEAIYEYYKDYIVGTNHELIKLIGSKLKSRTEFFPYIEWFYSVYLKGGPSSLRGFFEKLKHDEFENDKKGMKKLKFVNQCKIFVLENSRDSYNELIFCAGLVRFISGMAYALILSIIGIIKPLYELDPIFNLVLYFYLFLLLLFLMTFRRIRIKEVCTIFISYAYIKMRKDCEKNS